MKFLFVARQKKNVQSFSSTIALLLRDGHQVRLAIQERDPERDLKLASEFESPNLSVEAAPAARGDDWRTYAPVVRRLRDWVQYLGPQYAGTDKLRMRVVDRLRAELGLPESALGDGTISGLIPSQVERLRHLLGRIEGGIPPDPLHDQFLAKDLPDVVLITPGVHFGSAQADFVKSARAAGIPVWMLLFSWDNLSTKGALHVAPDLMYVWNERQRTEAAELHGFPPERVVAVGAPRFDEFFSLTPTMPRARFLEPLGLDASQPTLLYLCSSRFVASRELPFVRRWLAAIRASQNEQLRRCNVIVRPHPDIPLVDDDEAETVQWPELPRAQGWISRPFGGDRAIVLRTTYATQQAFYECLYHSEGVVGLNTSAELEAGIVGRPVFTVVADDEAVTGQASTLHFHYLLRENGGFVVSSSSLDSHLKHLASALRKGPDSKAIRSFIQEFLRPRGNEPVAHVLARELVAQFANVAPRDATIAETPEQTVVASMPTVQPATVVASAPEAELRLDYPNSTLRVIAGPETVRSGGDGGLLPLNPDVVTWLDTHVQPHDVVYDIGAGVGEYSLVAATHRGALVFAFEPGFATFKRLCDNILANHCERNVVPFPYALADRAGLIELMYEEEAPGEEQHQIKTRGWRPRPFVGPSYCQPVCGERLDDLVERHQLPKPTHMRVRVPRGADAILRGAVESLRNPELKSLLIIAPRRQARAAIEELLREAGLLLVPGPRRKEPFQVLRFVREETKTPGAWFDGFKPLRLKR